MRNVMRDDVPQPSLSNEKALSECAGTGKWLFQSSESHSGLRRNIVEALTIHALHDKLVKGNIGRRIDGEVYCP
jgi:hypothetical protein